MADKSLRTVSLLGSESFRKMGGERWNDMRAMGSSLGVLAEKVVKDFRAEGTPRKVRGG